MITYNMPLKHYVTLSKRSQQATCYMLHAFDSKSVSGSDFCAHERLEFSCMTVQTAFRHMLTWLSTTYELYQVATSC